MPATLLVSMTALLLIAAPPAQAQTYDDATLQPRYSQDATLSALTLTDTSDNAVSFTEAFSRTKYAYTANVDAATAAVKVTATVNHPDAYVRVIGTADFVQRNAGILFFDNSVALTSGTPSAAMNLSYGTNTVTVVVQAKALNEQNYTITVNRARPTQGLPDQQEQPGDHADLISQMHEWRNDPQWVSYKSHTDRWDRALLAFGEEVVGTSLTAMTAAEAQQFADRGWERWVPVAAALEELESAAQPPPQLVEQPPQQQDPSNQAPTVDAALADVTIVNESGTRTVSLSGTFSDADNDALTITARSSNESVATVSAASDGSSLTLSAQSRGTATITVTAADDRGGTVSDSFTVTVKAAPVVATFLTDIYPLGVGRTLEQSLFGTFNDADGDALTITAVSDDEAVATVSVSSDGSSLTVRGVAEGETTITLTAQDPDGNSVSDEIDVRIEPDSAEDDSDIVARYDANGDGSIDVSEYHQAVRDYAARTISYSELLEVVRAYLAP